MQLSSTHQLDWILTKYCFCSSMPDLTAIMPAHQNFTSYSGGGVVEIVHQEEGNPKFQQRGLKTLQPAGSPSPTLLGDCQPP